MNLYTQGPKARVRTRTVRNRVARASAAGSLSLFPHFLFISVNLPSCMYNRLLDSNIHTKTIVFVILYASSLYIFNVD